MIHRQCLHVALTLNVPYQRPKEFKLLMIAQAVGMVPAADNSFKYQNGLKGGKTTFVKKVGIYDPKHKGKSGKACVAMKIGAHDPNHKGKGARARNVVMSHKQWDDNQTQALLRCVIANFGFGQLGEL